MKPAKYSVFTLILYGLGFLLFWEWLRPLGQITNTGSMSVFVMFAAFAFLLSYLRLPLWITVPAKGLAALYALHSLFFVHSIFDLHWIVYLFQDMSHNVGLLWTADWDGLSDLFRSVLFFALLWFVSYMMHYWLVQARRMFLFFLATVLYVTVIDTFTVYDADAAIVRTVMIGFVLLGLLRFVRLQEKEKVSASGGRFPLTWISVLAVLLAVTFVVGFAAPKAGPQWPDPVPFITSGAQKVQGDDGGGNAIQRIGYGTNDNHLGGPFVDDDTPVFKVTTKEPRYWRVESKDVYTGKGWKNSKDGKWLSLDLQDEESLETAPDLYFNSVHTQDIDAEIHLAKGRKFPQLVYGGELINADMPDDVFLKMNDHTQKIKTIRGGDKISASQYGLTFLKPEFSIKQLRKTKKDPDAITDRYLQLPKSLPDRVRKLAIKVTEDQHNRYDKAKAVEQFFNGSEFSYDSKDVGVPGKNQDYTAQFLFDTQSGYCDNFSTSMAVMLRSIGIPTRWVKGFTPGDYEKTLDGGANVYQVTNANAHSWVEVYFPQAGWVPFEPTKDFTSTFDFVSQYEDRDVGEEASENPVDKEAPPEKEPKESQQNQQQPPPEQDNAAGVGDEPADTLPAWFVWSAILVLVVLMGMGIVFASRRKWLPLALRIRYKHHSGEDALSEAYERLLKLLPLYGMKRDTSETLREYATSIDRMLGTSEMKALTSAYERMYYRGDHSAQTWQESKALWETILKKLPS